MSTQANYVTGTAPPKPSAVAQHASSQPGAGAIRNRRKARDANIFRDAWQYRITGNGKARLDSRSGASPAFLSVLDIAAGGPVSFRDVSERLAHLGSDDLELWLSAMCSMDLLEPVDAPLDAGGSSGFEQVPAEHSVAAPIETDRKAVALLAHSDAATRASWRSALADSGYELLEATDLESIDSLIKKHRPAWVVLGLAGEDFDGLHVLRALKRPRAAKRVRVCLVLPDPTALGADANTTAARADVIATSAAEVAQALKSTHGEHAATATTAPQTHPEVAPRVVRLLDESPGIVAKDPFLLKTNRMNTWMARAA